MDSYLDEVEKVLVSLLERVKAEKASIVDFELNEKTMGNHPTRTRYAFELSGEGFQASVTVVECESLKVV